jgi:8-oxo-dGTP diphosphatase
VRSIRLGCYALEPVDELERPATSPSQRGRFANRPLCGTLPDVSDGTKDAATFYAGLPTKRVAAGLICRDSKGRVLLVRPTYGATWLVPGGVVETNESPAAAAAREAREELGLELAVGRLLVVDWLPPRFPKTEGLMFLFDGGMLDESAIARFLLPEDEIADWEFVEPADVAARASSSLGTRIEEALASLSAGDTRYLESGARSDPGQAACLPSGVSQVGSERRRVTR